MAEVVIREATRSDAAAIARVHIEGWRWGYRGLLPDALLEDLSVERRESRWHDILGRPAGEEATFVAEMDGRVVGFASCGPSQDQDAAPGTGELYSLYLEEGVVARGIGRALMKRVMQWLTARGFDRATLWVLVTNERARRFYEAGGWRPDGAEKAESHGFEGTLLPEMRYAITVPPLT
jgi:GNAT superfamily N-acetyltransferase